MKRMVLCLACLMAAGSMMADKTFSLVSPDGKVQSEIVVGKTLSYDIKVDGRQVLAPSNVSMTLMDGQQWGVNPSLKGQKKSSISQEIASPFYRQSSMKDECNVITLNFKDYSVEFRAYDNGVAYRFISSVKKPFEIRNEGVEYNFPADFQATVPYVRDFDPDNIEGQFGNSFENWYTTAALSQLDNRRYSFLPLVVDAGRGVKLCLTETHLENYPGLYLKADAQSLKGVFAPYPKAVEQGGHNNLQMPVISREEYIAKADAPRTFPWRVTMIARSDIELASNNLSYLLAAPCRVDDYSWVKPGKVAWDWWNDWNITGVPFRAGINDDTYKYYIDFASSKGIEYVILDEGWAVNMKADLMQVVPEIHLQEIVDYAASRNVGIILWAGYWAFDRDMEKVCKYFSEMGVKGFKVDFMDRDDQYMTQFYYRAAEMGAKYRLMMDFHGAFKPAGLNRTFPNVVNFEGVSGLETAKWTAEDEQDQVEYDCQIPFIRQASGPMDYTQGAMINAAKGQHRVNYSQPMSQGTRCHQLGLYMILESPLSMLCDSPTNYITLGGQCTDFIAGVPTVWDETRVLAGEMGKYVVTARRSGSKWYIGGITNWEARDVEIPVSFLGAGKHSVTSFTDGVNADRRGDDYIYWKSSADVDAESTFVFHMAPGGGFAVVVE